MHLLRMQMKDDWKKWESDEICINGKIDKIIEIHHILMSMFHED